jgi:hypothetical protein
VSCGKTVYPAERIVPSDNIILHKTCFRCAVCNSVLKTGNFSAYEGKYYCKPHFTQLFKMKGSYNSIAENTPDDGSGSNPPTPKGPQLEKTPSTAVLGGPSKNKDLISELKDKTDDAKPEDKKPAPERQTSSRFTNNAFIRQDSVSGNPPKETSHSRESSSSKDASSSSKPKEDDTKKSSSSSSSTTKSTSSSASSEKDVAPRDSVEYSTKQYWESRYKQYVLPKKEVFVGSSPH